MNQLEQLAESWKVKCKGKRRYTEEQASDVIKMAKRERITLFKVFCHFCNQWHLHGKVKGRVAGQRHSI